MKIIKRNGVEMEFDIGKISAAVAKANAAVEPGDLLILGAAGHRDEAGVSLREVTLRQDHPWAGLSIRQLDISRQTLVVMVRRQDQMILPDGDTVLRPGDTALLYTRRPRQAAARA